MWSYNGVTQWMLRGAPALAGLFAAVLAAQQTPAPAAPKPEAAKPLQVQSSSTYTESTNKDGEKVLDIRNVRYGVTGQGVPGLPVEQRLLLRISTRVRQVLDEVGVRGTVTLEAWPLGADPKTRPMYNPSITGTDAQVADDAVWVVSRGLEEVQWWTVLKLATTQRLFDTYVPPVHFSASRETLTHRYAGLEVPPSDTRDMRLRDPHVIAVFEYASADNLIREALLTCDDPNRAALLRSLADSAMTMTGPVENATEQSLTLTITQKYPSTPDIVTIGVPVANDDLDLVHAKLPAGLHLAQFKR